MESHDRGSEVWGRRQASQLPAGRYLRGESILSRWGETFQAQPNKIIDLFSGLNVRFAVRVEKLGDVVCFLALRYSG